MARGGKIAATYPPTPPVNLTHAHPSMHASQPFISGPPLQTDERPLCRDSGKRERGRGEKEKRKDAGQKERMQKQACAEREFWGCVGQLGEAAAGVHRDLACSPLVSRSLWQALHLIYGREPSLTETHETLQMRWRVWGKKKSARKVKKRRRIA